MLTRTRKDSEDRKPPNVALVRAVTGALLLAGCFTPDLSGAECVTCPEGACPGDLTCRAGYCVSTSTPSECAARAGAGSSSAGHGSAAGMTSHSPGTGGGGGAVTPEESGGRDDAAGAHDMGGTAGSITGSNGDGGAPDGPTENGLHIKLGLPEQFCTDTPQTADATVTGGHAPYHWNLEGSSSDLQVDAIGEGAKATLSGTLSAPEKYKGTLTVTDAESVTASIPISLNVVETPEITTAELQPVCPDQVYSWDLKATGGDKSKYVWSTDLAPETGLSADGHPIQGAFKNEAADDHDVSVSIQVESDGCKSTASVLTLKERGRNNLSCPSLHVFDRPALPVACIGQPYAATLTFDAPATDPFVPYYWGGGVFPAGLSFDSDRQLLSGFVSKPGTVTVSVDWGSLRFESSFDLQVHDKCWLAYEDHSGDVPRLGLFDPDLHETRTAPSSPLAAPVVDFKFAPDGRSLVYRSGTAPDSGQLTLLDLSTMIETPLGFDAVSQYEWSRETNALAVVFGAPQARSLGGIVLDASGAGAPFTSLVPVAARIETPLVWLAGSQVAFLDAFDTTGFWPVAIWKLGSDRFSPAHAFYEYFGSDAELRPATKGLYVIPKEDSQIVYYSGDINFGYPHDEVYISGTGADVAIAADNTASVFLAGQASWLPDVTPPESAGCGAVLAWAPARERFACSEPIDENVAQLNMFDFDPAASAITGPKSVNGADDLPNLAPLGRHRLFGPTGLHFAYTTKNAVALVKVVPEEAAVVFDRNLGAPFDTDDAVLAFSPDETLLAEQRGKELVLFEVGDTQGSPTVLATNLPVPTPCVDAPRARAGTFCGSPRTSVAFTWSADSKAIAYITDGGELRTVGLRALDQGLDTALVADGCTNCLSGTDFYFQP